jgi:hypothetical protein
MTFILIQSSSLSSDFSLLGPKIFRSTQLVFFPNMPDQGPYQSTTVKIIAIYTPNSELYGKQHFNMLHLPVGYLFNKVSTSYMGHAVVQWLRH